METTEKVTELPRHKSRSDPPARLSRDAKRVWRRVWAEAPAGHFDPEHFTLLATFCELVAMSEKTGKQVAPMDDYLDADGKLDPRARLLADLAPKIATLSGKLRLCVSSHTPSVHGRKQVSKPAAWWTDKK